MLRFLFALLAITLFLVLTLPVTFVEWLIARRQPGAGDVRALHMVQWILRVISKICGIQLTVLGREYIPKDGAVLYIANHRSIFDVLIVYLLCPSVTGFIAKKELRRIPLLSFWIHRLHCLFLDRDDIREGLKTILTAIDYMKAGISIVVFPEGTRGRSEDETELLPFHEGSFKIAVKSGCPIVPMAISHSSGIFEDHFPFIKPTEVTVEFGAPIYPDTLSREEKKFLGKQVQGIIHAMLVKNHS